MQTPASIDAFMQLSEEDKWTFVWRQGIQLENLDTQMTSLQSKMLDLLKNCWGKVELMNKRLEKLEKFKEEISEGLAEAGSSEGSSSEESGDPGEAVRKSWQKMGRRMEKLESSMNGNSDGSLKRSKHG